MENVAHIVNSVLDSRGWRGKVLEQMAVEIWPDVAGEHLARHTVAEKFKGGTLFIRSRSPMWSQELHFLEDRIIARINGRLRQSVVQKIRCRVVPPAGIKVGALKPNWEDPTFPEAPPLPPGIVADPNDEAAHHAAELATNIEDPEMRAVMERLIATSLRAGKAREEKS